MLKEELLGMELADIAVDTEERWGDGGWSRDTGGDVKMRV